MPVNHLQFESGALRLLGKSLWMMFAIVLMIPSPLVFAKYVDWYYSCLHFSDGTKVTSYLAIDQIKSPIRGIGLIFRVAIYL